MSTINRVITIASLLTLVCISSAVAKANDPSSVAKEYFNQWTSGNVSLGLHECWDTNAFFETTFSNDFSELSKSDKLYLQSIFATFITSANNTAEMKAHLKTAQIIVKDTVNVTDKIKRVNAELKTASTTRTIFVHLKLIKNKWKIINLGFNGKGLEALIPSWKKFKALGKKNTMVYWWEMMLSQVLSAKFPASKK